MTQTQPPPSEAKSEDRWLETVFTPMRAYINREDIEKAITAITSHYEQRMQEEVRKALDTFEHRIHCDTAISELYGWPSIVEMAKHETENILGLKSVKKESKKPDDDLDNYGDPIWRGM